MRIGAASSTGARTAASSGACRSIRSSSDSTPSSRNDSTAAAVKLFVIDAIRYTDPLVGWNPSSCTTVAPDAVTTPSHDSPQAIDGQWCSVANAPIRSTIASTSSGPSSNGVWLTGRR